MTSRAHASRPADVSALLRRALAAAVAATLLAALAAGSRTAAAADLAVVERVGALFLKQGETYQPVAGRTFPAESTLRVGPPVEQPPAQPPAGPPEAAAVVTYSPRELLTLAGGASLARTVAKDGASEYTLGGLAHLLLSTPAEAKALQVTINGVKLEVRTAHLFFNGWKRPAEITLVAGEAKPLEPPAAKKEAEKPAAAPAAPPAAPAAPAAPAVPAALPEGAKPPEPPPGPKEAAPLKPGERLVLDPAGVKLEPPAAPEDPFRAWSLRAGFDVAGPFTPAGEAVPSDKRLKLTRHGKDAQLTGERIPVFEGDKLLIGATQRVGLELVTGDRMTLYGGSTFTLDKFDTQPVKPSFLFTFAGRMRALIAPRAARGETGFRSLTATIGIKGTDFESIASAAATEVSVVEGLVGVGDAKGEGIVDVAAGFRTTVAQGQKPEPPKPIPPEELQKLQSETPGRVDIRIEAPRQGQVLREGKVEYRVTPEDAPIEVLLDDKPVTLKSGDPLPADLPDGQHRLTVRPALREGQPPAAAAGAAPTGAAAAAVSGPPGSGPQTVTFTLDRRVAIRIEAPKQGQVLREGKVEYRVTPEDAPVEVLIDEKPVTLKSGAALPADLADGEHRLTVRPKPREGQGAPPAAGAAGAPPAPAEGYGPQTTAFVIDKTPPALAEGFKAEAVRLREGQAIAVGWSEPLAGLRLLLGEPARPQAAGGAEPPPAPAAEQGQPLTLAADKRSAALSGEARLFRPGPQPYRLVATDGAGNRAEVGGLLTFVPRPPAPPVLTFGPGVLALVTNQVGDLPVQADRAMEKWQVLLGPIDVTASLDPKAVEKAQPQLTLPAAMFQALPDGEHKLTVQGTDEFGMMGAKTLSLVLDRQPPRPVLVIEPGARRMELPAEELQLGEGTYTIVWGEALSRMQHWLDDGPQPLDPTTNREQYRFVVNEQVYPENGLHRYRFRLTDLAGNLREVGLKVLIARKGPQLALASPAPEGGRVKVYRPVTLEIRADGPVDGWSARFESIEMSGLVTGDGGQTLRLPGEQWPIKAPGGYALSVTARRGKRPLGLLAIAIEFADRHEAMRNARRQTVAGKTGTLQDRVLRLGEPGFNTSVIPPSDALETPPPAPSFKSGSGAERPLRRSVPDPMLRLRSVNP
ncbi:MAG: hypothetical protein HY423_04375 [Candidatus Lambdaproteobacteria bacterium]|nr:hypothetical protein [Candidatus Lambdaproteobacteria bacterium]